MYIFCSYIIELKLGVLEGSIRKNSIGIDGAKCIAAILLHNRCLVKLLLFS